jgi:hypothetical protein
MVKTRNALAVPLWALLVAAVLLLALLSQARPVLAPATILLPATSTAPGPASSRPADSNAGSSAASQGTIDALKSAAPAAAPTAVTQLPPRGLAIPQPVLLTNGCSTNAAGPTMHPACVTGAQAPTGG